MWPVTAGMTTQLACNLVGCGAGRQTEDVGNDGSCCSLALQHTPMRVSQSLSHWVSNLPW